MIPLTNRIPAARRLRLRLPQRQSLTPEEQALRQVRRRLLRFIIETHRRREAERARGLSSISDNA